MKSLSCSLTNKSTILILDKITSCSLLAYAYCVVASPDVPTCRDDSKWRASLRSWEQSPQRGQEATSLVIGSGAKFPDEDEQLFVITPSSSTTKMHADAVTNLL